MARASPKVCMELDFPAETTIHHLRQTWRRYVADVLDPHVVQDWLGHSGMPTTFKVPGGRATERAKRRTVPKLEALYGDETE